MEREKLKVVVLVEPSALEVFHRQVEAAAQSERIDGELDVRVPLLLRFGLVIEDVEVPVADLEEINVAGDDLAIERQIESAAPVV